MKQFENIEHLNSSFSDGDFSKIPKFLHLTVDGHSAEFRSSSVIVPYNIEEFNSGKPLIIVYVPKNGTTTKRIALVWKLGPKCNFVPLLAKLVGKYRSSSDTSVMKESKDEDEEVIGTHLEVRIMNFNNNNPIRGKVDTGSDLCSLHATNINIKENHYEANEKNVTFDFEQSSYTMLLADNQVIRSADGKTFYRPVVEMDFSFDGKLFKNIKVNLADRTGMEDRLLIGLNFLQELDYQIDPTLEEQQDTRQEDLDGYDETTEEENAYIRDLIYQQVVQEGLVAEQELSLEQNESNGTE